MPTGKCVSLVLIMAYFTWAVSRSTPPPFLGRPLPLPGGRYLRLRRASSACWGFWSSKGCPVCRRFARQAYKVASASPKSCETLGMPSRSARSNACSLNCALYLLRTVCVVVVSAFLVFIIDLGVGDYPLSRVSANSGQDHTSPKITQADNFIYRQPSSE